MFRPLNGHLQAIEIYEIKITIASSFYVGRLRSLTVGVRVYMQIEKVKTLQYICQSIYLYLYIYIYIVTSKYGGLNLPI